MWHELRTPVLIMTWMVFIILIKISKYFFKFNLHNIIFNYYFGAKIL